MDEYVALLQEWTGGIQDDLVSLHLLGILMCQGHIRKLLVISELSRIRIFIEKAFDRAFQTLQ